MRFDAEGDLGVERVCDLGDDKSDDVCAAADEAAGQRVDTVALLVADFYDPLARRFAQLLGAAEGTGYGRSGDAGDAGDVLDGCHSEAPFLCDSSILPKFARKVNSSRKA